MHEPFYRVTVMIFVFVFFFYILVFVDTLVTVVSIILMLQQLKSSMMTPHTINSPPGYEKIDLSVMILKGKRILGSQNTF